MGSGPVLSSPLGARLRSGTEDNGGLSWHCHPSGCPMPRANREQRQRYRRVLGPLPLVCLGTQQIQGESPSSWPALLPTSLGPTGTALCTQQGAGPNLPFLVLFLATWEVARRCPLWDSEQLHSQGTASAGMQQGLAGSLPQPLVLWEAAVGEPGEGKGGEKEPLCRTVLSLVPRLRRCQRQTMRCRQEERAGGQQHEAPLGTEHPREQSTPDIPGVHW